MVSVVGGEGCRSVQEMMALSAGDVWDEHLSVGVW